MDETLSPTLPPLDAPRPQDAPRYARTPGSTRPTLLDPFPDTPELIARREVLAPGIEIHWAYWLLTIFPRLFTAPLAPYHKQFWEWVWSVTPGTRPDPFIAIWPRGWAKSTSIEAATVALTAMQRKRYILYISGTQDQADKHVASIAHLLEGDELRLFYPEAADRALTQYNRVRAWRRNRLMTASGTTIDALGMDTSVRGAKVDDQRPDLIIIDDIDAVDDSDLITDQKIRALTSSILPSGSRDLAFFGAQNLIHPRSIFARLARSLPGSEKYVPNTTPVADFLTRRIVSGPYPAVTDLVYETDEKTGRSRILTGRPTWDFMDLETCQGIIDDTSLTSFLRECQQEVDIHLDGMFAGVKYRRITEAEMAQTPLLMTQVWVDPAVTAHDDSDSCAIVIGSLGTTPDPVTNILPLYVQWVWEERSDPLEAIKLACLQAVKYNASVLGIETDQGGLTWNSVYREAWRSLVNDPSIPEITASTRQPYFKDAKAGSGHGPKVHRASQLLTDYEKGSIIHVIGPHHTLERALGRFPKKKPYDLCDALYWLWFASRGQYRPARKPRRLQVVFRDAS